jgi:ParB/RepB/Spo0J family partition protein
MKDAITAESGFRAITLEQLQVSTTEAQAQRRKHFDKTAMAELADSIKMVGIVQPIIVRPINGHFEIVAGERRFIAAKAAGLSEISVNVRAFTDEQVIEIQLIENLQREGLHPLAEAEGYDKLQSYGHSAEEIADKIGKSKGYVYSRLKLCGLAKASRTAFYDGKLTASTALLLARIPIETLQLEALKEITNKKWGEPIMSFRDAASHVRDNYMTNLSDAGFPTEDANLVAAAGACGACPKRTGNQAELFDDVKSGNVCTDPICFKAKRQAHAAREIAKAEDDGRTVIVGKKAKDILPAGDRYVRGGFQGLEDRPYQDPKRRTVAQLLGKGFVPTLVQDPESGKLVKVAPESAVKAALKIAGVKQQEQPRAKSQTKAKREDAAFCESVFLAIHAKAPKKMPHALLVKVIDHELDAIGMTELLHKTWGMKDFSPKGLAKLNEGQLHQLLFEIDLLDEIDIYGASGPSLLKAVKDLGIDVKKIRAELTAPVKPAKKPKGKKKA